MLCRCRVGVNMFTRIPLNAGPLFVGSLVFGVRKVDLVAGGRVFPPYAAYHNWGNIPGFTIVPSKTEVRLSLAAQHGARRPCSSPARRFAGVGGFQVCRACDDLAHVSSIGGVTRLDLQGLVLTGKLAWGQGWPAERP